MNKNNIILLMFLFLFITSSLNAQKESEEFSIHEVVSSGNLAKVKEILFQNPELINLKDNAGWTPLFLASWSVHKEMVEFLVSEGADVNTSDRDGYTPLHNTIAGANYSGDAFAIMKFLVEKGANVNSKTYEGLTPLHWAARSGKIKIAEFLITKGANINSINNLGETPLHLACRNGFKEFVERLLELQCDIEITSKTGASSLTESVKNGYADITILLINGGANVNICAEESNMSLLHLASIYGFYDIANILIENGLDINQLDLYNNKPIDYAQRYKHYNIVTLLNSKGNKIQTKELKLHSISSLSNELKGKKITIWKIWGGWAMLTTNYFIILEYWERRQLPQNPCLANGHINPEEIGNLKSLYFVYRYHPQAGGKKIYEMDTLLENITYFQHNVLNSKEVEKTVLIKPRETKIIEDIKVSTISQPGGLGYFLEIDSVRIFSPFMNNIREPNQSFKHEVDFIDVNSGKCDLAFLKINTESEDAQKTSLLGLYYSINKLSPNNVFIEIDDDKLRTNIIDKLRKEYKDINFFNYISPGDHLSIENKYF